MSEWFEGRLADLCESIDYGLTASASADPNGPKFLRITDIVGDALNWREVPFVQATPNDTEKFKLNDEDIVIARLVQQQARAGLSEIHPCCLCLLSGETANKLKKRCSFY